MLKWSKKQDRFEVAKESYKNKFNNNLKYRNPNAEYGELNLIFGIMAGIVFVDLIILLIVLI